MCVGLFGCSSVQLSAADWTWTCRQFNVANDDDPIRITIVNSTSDNYQFRHVTPDGTAAVSDAATTSSTAQATAVTISGVPTFYTLATTSVGSSYNPVVSPTGTYSEPGTTTTMYWNGVANNTSGANHGSEVTLNFSGKFAFRKQGDTAWTLRDWSGSATVQFNYSGSGSGLAAGGGLMAAITFTGPPAPNSGVITVSGLHGNYNAVLQLDGVTVGSSDNLPADPLDSSDPGPNIEFETDDPDSFVGQEVTVRVNGYLSYTGVVELDMDGNFEILISASAWEYPQRVVEPGGMEVPTPDDDLAKEPLDDPDHVRDAPGPIPGADPKTDTSDNLTVQDSYRATRAAIEDALRTPNGPRFNFDEWRGSDRADGDAEGAAAGGGIGDGLGAVADAADSGFSAMTIPMGGALTLAVAGRSFTVPTFEIASTVRLFLLIFLLLFVFMRAVSIARGAFSSES